MNRLFIDTGFALATISPRDQYHQRAIELSQKYDGYPLVTTYPIIMELGNAFARNLKPQAIELIEYFFNSSEVTVINIDEEAFQRAFTIYKTRLDKMWGLVDCISFVVMQDENITYALTFDQHFVQGGFQIAQ